MARSAVHLTMAMGAAIMFLSSASAQDATPEQKEALRSHCTGDFIRHCRGVPSGGLPAFQCLEENLSKLSSGCQEAVKAVDPTGDAAIKKTN